MTNRIVQLQPWRNKLLALTEQGDVYEIGGWDSGRAVDLTLVSLLLPGPSMPMAERPAPGNQRVRSAAADLRGFPRHEEVLAYIARDINGIVVASGKTLTSMFGEYCQRGRRTTLSPHLVDVHALVGIHLILVPMRVYATPMSGSTSCWKASFDEYWMDHAQEID